MPDKFDDTLDDLFAEARAQRAEPSPELMARVLEDALAEQSAQAARAAPTVSIGWFRGFLTSLGGLPGVAGLATAAAAGVMIGYSPPEALGTFDFGMLSQQEAPTLEVDDFVALDDFLLDG